MNPKITWLFHFISYYLCWVACIYFAATNHPYWAPVIGLLLIALQISWQFVNQLPWRGALSFALTLGVLGALTDTVWLANDLIYFNANPFTIYFAAPWMICLWISFGFNLIITSKQFLSYFLLWGIAALLFLPLAYWLGVRFGAATLHQGQQFYLYLGLLWSLLLPSTLYLYLKTQND